MRHHKSGSQSPWVASEGDDCNYGGASFLLNSRLYDNGQNNCTTSTAGRKNETKDIKDIIISQFDGASNSSKLFFEFSKRFETMQARLNEVDVATENTL